jgi:hypothetical protein
MAREATQAELHALARLEAAERELDEARRYVQEVMRRESRRLRLTLIVSHPQPDEACSMTPAPPKGSTTPAT